MLNVKDQVYEALCSVDADLDVSDVYPSTWEHEFTCQYMEEENSVYTKTDATEQAARLRFAIYLWSNKSSLSELAVKVDEKLSALGLWRTQCADANDPSGRRHKIMRYEGIIDVDTEVVSWDSNR